MQINPSRTCVLVPLVKVTEFKPYPRPEVECCLSGNYRSWVGLGIFWRLGSENGPNFVR